MFLNNNICNNFHRKDTRRIHKNAAGKRKFASTGKGHAIKSNEIITLLCVYCISPLKNYVAWQQCVDRTTVNRGRQKKPNEQIFFNQNCAVAIAKRLQKLRNLKATAKARAKINVSLQNLNYERAKS